MNTSAAVTVVKRNPFMRLRFTRPLQIDLLLENQTFEVLDHDVICAVVHAEQPICADRLAYALDRKEGSPKAQALVQELLRARVLVAQDYRNPLQDAAEHWQQRGWLDALVLHLRSRNVAYHDFGAQAFIGPQRSALIETPACAPCIDSVCASRGDIVLPPGAGQSFQGTLYEAMSHRRTGRPWTGRPMNGNGLADILRYGNLESLGNREETANDKSSDAQAVFDRSSFAALETYVVVNRVEGVPQGVYRYSVTRHALLLISHGDFNERLVDMCIGQAKVRNCAAALVIGTHWARYYGRYRHPRAYRNLLINCAELAHYYILCATAAGLSNFITPAFNDEVAEAIIGKPCTDVGPLYMVAIG